MQWIISYNGGFILGVKEGERLVDFEYLSLVIQREREREKERKRKRECGGGGGGVGCATVMLKNSLASKQN